MSSKQRMTTEESRGWHAVCRHFGEERADAWLTKQRKKEGSSPSVPKRRSVPQSRRPIRRRPSRTTKRKRIRRIDLSTEAGRAAVDRRIARLEKSAGIQPSRSTGSGSMLPADQATRMKECMGLASPTLAVASTPTRQVLGVSLDEAQVIEASSRSSKPARKLPRGQSRSMRRAMGIEKPRYGTSMQGNVQVLGTTEE